MMDIFGHVQSLISDKRCPTGLQSLWSRISWSTHADQNYKNCSLKFHLDEEQRFMYDCHPQPSHQLTFDQGVQINIYPKFSGLCTRTNRSHLAVFCIDRNAIGCYDFVRMDKWELWLSFFYQRALGWLAVFSRPDQLSAQYGGHVLCFWGWVCLVADNRRCQLTEQTTDWNWS